MRGLARYLIHSIEIAEAVLQHNNACASLHHIGPFLHQVRTIGFRGYVLGQLRAIIDGNALLDFCVELRFDRALLAVCNGRFEVLQITVFFKVPRFRG